MDGMLLLADLRKPLQQQHSERGQDNILPVSAKSRRTLTYSLIPSLQLPWACLGHSVKGVNIRNIRT